MLGEDKQREIVDGIYDVLKEYNPNATEESLREGAEKMARQQSDQRVFDVAVENNAPKNALDHFFRKAIGMNSIMRITEGLARQSAGTTGDWEARDVAEQEFDHGWNKVAGIGGTVAGFVFDPLTYLAGGAGGAAAKGGNAALRGIMGGAAARKFSTTLGGRAFTGALAGAGNLGTYEAASEAINQFRWGGELQQDQETGRYMIGDYNPGKIAGQFGHGALMGSATGIIAPMIGNVSDKLVNATESTIGKAGVRTGELALGTVAEGTVFSIPEFVNTYIEYGDAIAALSDENSPMYIADEAEREKAIEELAAKRKGTMMDVWTDNMAMMAGFKAQHFVKSAPRRIAELRSSGRGKAGFETRLREMLNGREGLALTEDEKRELNRSGYGDLGSLVEEYEDFVKSRQNRSVRPERMLEGGVGEPGEIPYNRFEQMMSDPNVSESARAKMYYYLTGNVLPMSTVTGSTFTEVRDPNGNLVGYQVQSMGNNGVITSKTFKSEKAARAEENKILRQVELNAIDGGERWFDSKNQRRIENEPTLIGERKTSADVRQDLFNKYFVDIDKAVKKEPTRRSKVEQQAVDEYINTLWRDVIKEQETEQRQHQESKDEVLRLTAASEGLAEDLMTENDPTTLKSAGHDMRDARRSLSDKIGEERMQALEGMDADQLADAYTQADADTKRLMDRWMVSRGSDAVAEGLSQRSVAAAGQFKESIVSFFENNAASGDAQRSKLADGMLTLVDVDGSPYIVVGTHGRMYTVKDVNGNARMVDASQCKNERDVSLDQFVLEQTAPELDRYATLAEAFNGTDYTPGQVAVVGEGGRGKQVMVLGVDSENVTYADGYTVGKDGQVQVVAERTVPKQQFRDMVEQWEKQAEQDAKRQASLTNVPVSQMEAGMRFPVEWRGEIMTAEVVEEGGKKSVNIVGQDGSVVERGINDFTDEDWQAIRTVAPEPASDVVAEAKKSNIGVGDEVSYNGEVGGALSGTVVEVRDNGLVTFETADGDRYTKWGSLLKVEKPAVEEAPAVGETVETEQQAVEIPRTESGDIAHSLLDVNDKATYDAAVSEEVENALAFAKDGDTSYIDGNLESARQAVEVAEKKTPTSTGAAQRRAELETIGNERAAARKLVEFWEAVAQERDRRNAVKDVVETPYSDIVNDGRGGLDDQGNILNSDGSVFTEKVNFIDEITDEDFENPNRSIELPQVPNNVADAIGTNGRPIIIKKNIFGKNGETHVDLDPSDSREILSSALYNPNLVGQTQPKTRPDYKVAIRTGDKNSVVVLDIYEDKKQVDIVGWRRVNEKGLEKMKKQAEREGGQFLILSPKDGSAAALSALPQGLNSETITASVGKDNTISGNASEIAEKNISDRFASIERGISDARANGESSRVEALTAEKAEVIQEYLDSIKTDDAYVLTASDYESVLTANGAKEKAIQKVRDMYAYTRREHKLMGGFNIDGKIYVFADDVRSIDDARSTYVHERQHNINDKDVYLLRDVKAAAGRDELLSYVQALSGTHAYDNKTHTTLADEFLAMSMEVAYKTDDVETALREMGIENEELINIIKRLDDEQRTSDSLANARRREGRDTYVDNNGQGSGRPDGTDQGRRPAEVGGQGLRPDEGGRQETEGVRVSDEGVTSISDAAEKEGSGIEVGGDTRFNIATEPQLQRQIKDYVKTRDAKRAGWTDEKVSAVVSETEDLIKAIDNALSGEKFYKEWSGRMPTVKVDWRDGEEKPTVTWTRGNIDYKYDMSADLLCINNEGMEDVLSSPTMVDLMLAMQKGKKGFTSDDYMTLYNTLDDLGFVVPCKGCFDAAARFKMLPSVSQEFVDLVNETIDRRNKDKEAFDNRLRELAKKKKGKPLPNGLPASASNKEEAIEIGVAGDDLTEHITWTQLMSATGQTNALYDWGGVFRAWQRTGAGRPKDKLLPEPYSGDIMSPFMTIVASYGKKTPSFREQSVNVGTGLRRNSHSEFRPILAVDEIQFMRDAYLRNLMVFKYMKELDDVRLFGKMGVKFNMSFFPAFVEGAPAAGLDKDGNYIASEESVGSREFEYVGEDGRKHYDGMKGFQEAQKYVNDNVSLSSVVFSVPHLIKAFTDVPTPSDKSGVWGSLIPFHNSGATKAQIRRQGLGEQRATEKTDKFEVEAMTDYDKGVTNFEQVQNDRFGEGWFIVEGKKKGNAVEPGHKLEFSNGTHYYNKRLGLHLFNSFYIYDNEIPSNMELVDGKYDSKKLKKLGHEYSIDYNDKVRELNSEYGYKEAVDEYVEFMRGIGLVPRFDFTVPEATFLEMCERAKVDPRHPKLGWKGEGNGWSPADAESYYSLWCDYGMTDPATGKWSPHRPVGYIDENGDRSFRMPDNTVDIVREGVARYSERKRAEESRVNEAITEFTRRSVDAGKLSEEEAERILGEGGISYAAEEEIDGNESVRFSIVDDPKEIARLENEPTEIGYRNVVLNEDGTLGSPMADRLGKKGAGRAKTSGFEFGKWEKSDEHPELATEDGKIDLIKPDGKPVQSVDYNPYIHMRPTLVNKQFKQAWERPNLVYVRTEYPASELTSGYHADKAKKSVGRTDWNGGELILSRWDKPVEIVPWEEVADDWMKEFGNEGIHFDIIPPKLLPILTERGANIIAPHKGMGKACNDAYNEWLKSQGGDDNGGGITPKQDADYMDAVNRGDMETAQRMVLEAAKAAMPNTKVVDENGMPLAMYHTTPNEFTVFDKDRINTSGHGKFLGYGLNFAAHQTTYGNNVIKAFLDAKNPLKSNVLTLSEEQVVNILKKLGLGYSITRQNDEQFREYVHNELRFYGGSDAKIYQWISNFSFDANDVMEIFEELGYDSSITYNSADKIEFAVVFRPNQIKSADPVTYDDQGNVIPLSERFNEGNDDIRFRVTDDSDATEVKTKIEDVGEKIGGAKKDLAQQMSGKIKLDADTFPKMFPKFDLKKSVEQGLDPHMAAAVMMLRQDAAKEFKRQSKNLGKSRALNSAKFFAAYAQRVLNEGDTDVNFSDSGWAFTDYGKALVKANIELYGKIYDKLGNDMFDIDLSDYEIIPLNTDGARSVTAFRRTEDGGREEFKPSYEARTKLNREYFKEGEFDKAVSKVIDAIDSGVSYEKSHPFKLSLYYNRNNPNALYVGVKIGKDVVALTDTFRSSTEARAYMDEHNAELQAEAARKQQQIKEEKKTQRPEAKVETIYADPSKGYAGGYVFAVKLGKEYQRLVDDVFTMRESYIYMKDHMAELKEQAQQMLDQYYDEKEAGKGWKPQLNLGGGRERVGEDYRGGSDIGAEKFKDMFGFRGVEFGNYVSQKERQRYLNEAYDALLDMASLLGVSPRALSLGGQLGFAIGSRGGGNNAAHYEPELNVINLTKTHGAGSLAHEWWHALDYFFNQRDGQRRRPATSNTAAESFDPIVRREMADAFVRLMDEIRDSDYYKRSVRLDRRLDKNYFATDTELGARAFQDYVQRKLTEQGQVNDFLSTFTPEAQWNGEAETYPYPIDSEVDAIDGRLDDLFGTVEEREDEAGNRVLFRVTEDEDADTIDEKYDAGVLSRREMLAETLLDMAQRNKDDNQAKMDAIRAVARALNETMKTSDNPNFDIAMQDRSVASAQRTYDKATVDGIVRLARMMSKSDLFKDFSRGEVNRLLTLVKNAAGRRDISQQANKVADMMLQHAVKEMDGILKKQLNVKGVKTNAQGVMEQGRLDLQGQRVVDAMKRGMELDDASLQELIDEANDGMGSDNESKAANAAVDYQGYMLAKQYIDDIKASKAEEDRMRDDIRKKEQEVKDGELDRKAYNEFVAETERAIRENKVQRVNAYGRLLTSVGQDIRDSFGRAKAFREAQMEHVNDIHHNANSDLEGMPSSEHSTADNKLINSSATRFLLRPLATFDEMLRFFGRKSVDGKGYLFNRFMTAFRNASDMEHKNRYEDHKELDAKVSDVFGKNMRWSDLFAVEGSLPTINVSFRDGGEMKDHELTQGKALYVYMVNKMTDGRMKLRAMGITDDDVQAIKDQLDPRFVELADWVQGEFLPKLRERYNEVHTRMFGAPMDAIEDYFRLEINDRSRGREMDISAPENDMRPSTVTGSIKKRVKNSTALDLTNTDAFDMLLGNIDEMEHWAAFAEFNRDINILLSYNKFRNRVMNMTSARYGSGETLWNNFVDTARIVAGVYRPKVRAKDLDNALVNMSKGVTAAKISFRLFTALKQLMSYPAYLSEASPVELVKSSNPVGAVKSWNWAMENLPGFAKRWQSRQAGDTRLKETDVDWGLWKNKIIETAGRLGMTPNAFVDAMTVAMGSKAVYETALKRYMKDGYSKEAAEEKAKMDAYLAYNETQQSSEGAFVSAMQLDRTMAATALTVFGNARMAYTRRFARALENMKKMARKGFMEENMEYAKKQMVRDGLTEEQAEEAAKRSYRRAWTKMASDLAIFGWVLQFAWNLSSYLPYLLFGDDDDMKDEMLKDAALHAVAGGVEGLSGGSIMSEYYNTMRKRKEYEEKYGKAPAGQSSGINFTTLPIMSDIKTTLQHFDQDDVRGINDIVNLVIQAGVGVNPQTITDAVVAIVDAANGDMETGKEIGMLLMRLAQVPQSQVDNIYIDELGMTAKDAKNMDVDAMAKRYARYKNRRDTFFTGWMYDEGEREKAEERYAKRFDKKIQERIQAMDDDELTDALEDANPEMKQKFNKEYASRQGISYSKSTTDYGAVYDQLVTPKDISEDAVLRQAKKDAKETGDERLYKEIDSFQRQLTNIKKGASYHIGEVKVKDEDSPGLGKGEKTDESVMRNIRKQRELFMKRHGLTQ